MPDTNSDADARAGASRRQVLYSLGGAVVATGLAGCTGSDTTASTTTTASDTARSPTTATTAGQTTAATETTTTDKSTTTTAEEFTVAGIRDRRRSLTEEDKRERYRSGIPDESGYQLDPDKVMRENETRREQLIDVTATVGDQYEHWVRGNHAVLNVMHDLDWMGWENDNIVNIVTRYNSAPGEQGTINYSTENGGRNLDGAIARDSVSGEDTYIKNIPDSELMNGDDVNFLVTDIENLAKSIEDHDWDSENYKAARLELQTVIPGVKGPSNLAERPRQDRGIVFDSEAIQYIGESYDESADAVNEVTEDAMEIHMSSMPAINSGRSVGVTAGENGLEVDAGYSQEEAEEKLREPIEL